MSLNVGDYTLPIKILSHHFTRCSEKFNYRPCDLFYYKFIVHGLSVVSKINEKFSEIEDVGIFNYLIQKELDNLFLKMMSEELKISLEFRK